MGPMMGGSSGWDPGLIVLVILLAVAVAVALTVTLAVRSGRPGRRRLRTPGSRPGDSQPTAGTGQGADPLAILRERYARGELSHPEFVAVLDKLLRAEQDPVPSAPGRLSHTASRPEALG